MYTIIAMVLLVAAGWSFNHLNAKDREVRAHAFDEAEIGQAVVHSRQDIRLVAILLAGILVMLGMIADRIH
jgi:hypothetical protein